MLIIATSPEVIRVNGQPGPGIVQALIDTKVAGNPVGLISNHAKPAWFNATFGSSGVQFLRAAGGQDGRIISENSAHFSLQPYDALVITAKP